MKPAEKLMYIKDDFYSTFKGNSWFRGAALYNENKKDWCIMTFIMQENYEDVPDIWKGMKIKKMIIT